MSIRTLRSSSALAFAKFISLAEQMTDDLLRPYGHVIIALSVVLKIRRTLTGAEIDEVIATVMAGFELAAERRRGPIGRIALCRPRSL